MKPSSASSKSSADIVVRSSSLKELRTIAAAGKLFAVFDVCDNTLVTDYLIQKPVGEVMRLYTTQKGQDNSLIEPYIALVDGSMIDWIVEMIWNEPWGIFINAEMNIVELRRHLKRYVFVEDPQGKILYFRFYDPRVLLAFLPTCTPTELRQFYGKIKAFATGKSIIQTNQEQSVEFIESEVA